MRVSDRAREAARIAALGILFLFFVQAASVLVQSVYILDLMNLRLDAKAAALLFLFSPLLLPLLRGRAASYATPASLALLLAARLALPWLGTSGRLLASGLAAAAFLLLLPLSWEGLAAGGSRRPGLRASQGFALSIALSVLLRALGRGLDASLEAGGGWLGLLLGLLLLPAFGLGAGGYGLKARGEESPGPGPEGRDPAAGADGAGLLSLLALSWLAFSSPGSIARWAGLAEPPVSLAVSLLALLYIPAAERAPEFAHRLDRRLLGLWNAAFVGALAGLLLLSTPAFPRSPGEVLELGPPGAAAGMLLGLLLALYPVIFLDFALLAEGAGKEGRRRRAGPSAAGLLAGGAWICLLVFANIFSNVWAYVPPASLPFRGRYWLSFALAAALPGLLALRRDRGQAARIADPPGRGAPGPGARVGPAGGLLLALIFGASLVAELLPGLGRPAQAPAGRQGLRVMTYNIQQGVDGEARRAWAEQLELIRSIDPDLLALQESDSARISLGNDDLVRRFAAELGYHSFYGPGPAAGTFGTAILSRYPIKEPRVLYSYSDEDEVGTSLARIEAPGGPWSIYCVHPAGSEAVDLAFARALLGSAAGKARLVALGDFNLRKGEAAYGLIEASLTEAWSALRPEAPDPDPARGWIDHIFVSPEMGILEAAYIPPLESHSDHPAHWAELGQ